MSDPARQERIEATEAADEAAATHRRWQSATDAHHNIERRTVYLSAEERKQFADDLLRLDAHVLARTAGGIRPRSRRAEVRRKLLAAAP